MFMKKIYLFAALLTFALGVAQESGSKSFTSSDKEFNDWAISVYGGTALIQTGDLTSIENGVGNWDFGYDVQLGITKAVSHAFALVLQGQYGKTNQRYQKHYEGHTDYFGFSLLGDINLTSLFRRIDNDSEYKWALHAFAGPGLINYKAYRNMFSDVDLGNQVLVNDQQVDLGTFYAQVGGEVKYKLNNKFDINFRTTYYFTGDEEFDGSGDPIPGYTYGQSVADVEESREDNFMTISLGLTYKLGKHDEYLMWHDPLQELYAKTNVPVKEVKVCEKGDTDVDGVCDDWDKCPNTPKGARVDGAGCPLDIDQDGVIDLYDKCVTVFGESQGVDASKLGCPKEAPKSIGGIVDPNLLALIESNDFLKGVEFDLNKSTIRSVSIPILDNAASVLKKIGVAKKWYVEGHTDSRGSDAANLSLSQRRAQSVVNYLVSKGVPAEILMPVGKGETDLLYPECNPATNCDEAKNLANRRVIFKPVN